jgi:hypothetical protein
MAFAGRKLHSGGIHGLFQNAAEKYGKANVNGSKTFFSGKRG